MSNTAGWLGAMAIIVLGSIGLTAFALWLYDRDSREDGGPDNAADHVQE